MIAAVTVTTIAIAMAFFFGGYFVRGWVDGGQEAAVLPTQTPVPAVGTLVVGNVSPDDDPARGPENAAVTIIEFSDFQCPYSGSYFNQTLPLILSNYGDKVRYVYRFFPLSSIHPEAEKAAEAAECAYEQGEFWEYHDILYQNQNALGITDLKAYAVELGLDESAFDLCLDSGKYADEVAKDVKDGQSYGVSGTPTFFVNGRKVVGALPYTTWQSVIDEELSKASSP
jgi:protein-disulfide isomerase